MATKIPIFWAPQEGPQTLAAICPCDYIFYGGTRGGGKSDTAIGRQIYGALKYGIAWNSLIIRRKYKDLAEIIRRINELIQMGLPADRVGGDKETNYIKFTNGARMTLTAIQMLDQVNDWQGHQFTEIAIDEAPTFPFIAQLIDRLKGSMRSPHGVPCHMFLTGNPGGSGASVIKLMYIDRAPANTIVRNVEDSTSSIFIKSTIYDNKILVEKDPKYVNRLMSISDPLLRAAWLEGRWDVFVGQAFDLTERHQIDPIWPIPQYAPIYMTFDWGFGAPFSIGWWWVDADGRGYRFAEWYGWNEVTPNVGLRLTDPEIAEGILERERKLGIIGRKIVRVSGPDCFSRKPNYLGGGQGPSTAEELQKYGERPEIAERYGKVDLTLIPGDADRKKKIRQFRKYLSIPKDSEGEPTGEMPMIMVYKTCRHFIRIIPQLTLDDTDLEDLEDHQEDHPYDEACHFCMTRPISLDTDEEYKVQKRQKKIDTIKHLDNVSKAASQELYMANRQLIELREQELPDDMAPELYGLPGDMDPEDLFA